MSAGDTMGRCVIRKLQRLRALDAVRQTDAPYPALTGGTCRYDRGICDLLYTSVVHMGSNYLHVGVIPHVGNQTTYTLVNCRRLSYM